ncbi:MAG: 50S ribosomal protein L3 [Candidatus Eisenbacteria bacterium]|uniref:Large ribosomal subunit protein uL3 n=1 Tax=Eiseniibacteriota bacterium TaxID=2212470 RepID=A0A538TRY8_UNCEI|nr:MAG: 50S ribosomal protein L3 [Candidatus Eisenbacteria bacterium]
MIGLLAQKIGMSQVYDEKGHVVPVTILSAGPCPVVQVKTSETDGYAAVQIGFGKRREKLIPKALQGHMKKHKAAGLRMLREIRVEDPSAYEIGQTLTVALFEVGVKVDVVGVSKGRGFAGVVRRHHFTAGRATHGCTTHKQPGSIGASAYPSRVVKGKRLPGRMGGARVTVRNLDVIGVDPDQNLIWLRGCVPGHPNGTVLIRKNG